MDSLVSHTILIFLGWERGTKVVRHLTPHASHLMAIQKNRPHGCPSKAMSGGPWKGGHSLHSCPSPELSVTEALALVACMEIASYGWRWRRRIGGGGVAWHNCDELCFQKRNGQCCWACCFPSWTLGVSMVVRKVVPWGLP